MNWRKYWKKGVCTLLIVTAEAHRVYDATRPRTRKPGPGAAGQDEQLFVSKQSAFNQTSTPKSIRLIFGRAFPLVECSTERTRTRNTAETHVEVTLNVGRRSSRYASTNRGGGTTAYASC